MKKGLFTFVFGLFGAVWAFSQASFERTYGSTFDQFENIQFAEPLDDGGHILAGYRKDSLEPTYFETWLLRTDADGKIVWQKTLGAVGKNDGPVELQKSSEGHFFLLIRTIESEPPAWIASHRILKFDASGSIFWDKNYSDNLEVVALAPSADGGCAFAYSGAGSPLIYKLNSFNGQPSWVAGTFATFGTSSFLAASPDGGYLFGGRDQNVQAQFSKRKSGGQTEWTLELADSLGAVPAKLYPIRAAAISGGWAVLSQTETNFQDRLLIKIDAAGKFVFQKKLAVPSSFAGAHEEIKALPDGSILALTYNTLFRYDSSGNFLAKVEFNVPAVPFLSLANDLVLRPNGEIEIVGNHINTGGGADGGLQTVDQNFAPIAQKAIGDGLPSDIENGWAVREAADGGFFVAGQKAFANKGIDFFLFKTDPTGNVIWEKNFGQTGPDLAYSLNRLADGNLLMTGRRQPTGAMPELVLMKIDSDGDLIWEKNYPITGISSQTSAIERPDGSLFVFYRNGQRAWAMRTTVAGDSIWTRRINNSSGVRGSINSQSGDVAAVGWLTGAINGAHFFRLTDDGVFSADVSHSIGDGIAYGIEKSADGGFWMSGFCNFGDSQTNFQDSVFVYKLNASGQKTGEKFFVFGDAHSRPRLTAAAGGGYYLTGISLFETNSGITNNEVFVQKMDAQAEPIWANLYGTTIENEFVYDSQGMADGGVVVVGSGQKNGSTDIYLLRTAADGSVKTVEIKSLGDLKISPNPTNGPFVVAFENEKTGPISLEIFDEKGQLIAQFSAEKSERLFEKTFSAAAFPTGLLAVKVSMAGRSIAQNFIKF